MFQADGLCWKQLQVSSRQRARHRLRRGIAFIWAFHRRVAVCQLTPRKLEVPPAVRAQGGEHTAALCTWE